MRQYLIATVFSLLIFLTVGCDKPAALHEAIRNGDETKVENLLKSGVDANGGDRYGQTALCAVAYEGDSKMAKLLIKHGADVNLCAHVIDGDKHVNQFPLTMALERQNRRGFPSDYFALAILLIENGANVNVVDVHGGGQSPLHYATSSREVTESLLKHGANINAKDLRGDSPLHHAVRLGRANIIPVLLSHGADPTISNNNGKTPVDYARDKQKTDLMALFEKHLQDKGETP